MPRTGNARLRFVPARGCGVRRPVSPPHPGVRLTALISLAVLGAAMPATAQSTAAMQAHEIRLVGTVRTAGGEVLPGVTVAVAGTGHLAVTGGDGDYTLVFTHAPGRVVVSAALDGFQTGESAVEVSGPLDTRLDFTLTPAFATDVVVLRDVPLLDTADDVSRVELEPDQIAALPSLGERDLFRALQLLPGVAGSNETSSGLFVRGGRPDQNRIEYDGFRAYHVDHLFGYFSAFNMAAVEDVQLDKGGFEAQHGGALSSVMQVTGRSGDREYAGGSVGVGLLSVNGQLEAPLFGGAGSGLVAVRRSFQGPLYDTILDLFDNSAARSRIGGDAARLATFSSRPSSSFYDVNGKLVFDPSSADSVSLSFYRGNDGIDLSGSVPLPGRFLDGLRDRGIDPARLGLDETSGLAFDSLRDYGTTGVGLIWERQWRAGVGSRMSLGYSRFSDVRDRGARLGRFSLAPTGERNSVEDLMFKAAAPMALGAGHTLEAGVEVTSNSLEYTFQTGALARVAAAGETAEEEGATGGALELGASGLLAAAYLQDRWLIGSRLLIVPGIRLTRFDRTGAGYTEPRLAGTLFVTDDFKLKAAAGRYYQFTNRIIREDVLQGDREFWSLSDAETVPVAEATHLIGGATYARGGLVVDVELFSKDLSHLTLFAPRLASATAGVDFTDYFHHGTGTVRGGELLVQKRSGRHTGWVSYTLSTVEETFPALQADPFPAAHDQRHEVKLVNLLRFGRWRVANTWIYASGRPYTEPLRIEADTLPGGFMVDRVVTGPKHGHRLPPYHRMDASLNRAFLLGDAAIAIVRLSLFNLYDRRNIWYTDFNAVEGQFIPNDIRLMGRTFNAAVTMRF